ncbi:DTW domain-containing protein YfiP [Roseateles sp. YR242]|nr:DTW domain-containing protein YfiP [Roseateles sp. YR242]
MQPISNPVPLLILQHPDEVHQAKNTAALLHRCLDHSTLQVGEQFAAPATMAGMVLLYPDTPGDVRLPAPPTWRQGPDGPVQTLVVLDATWRKSRRMLYLNPWLAALPRLSLQAAPPSRYAIRRAQGEDQRSTLEASAWALAQLDGNTGRYAPLWRAMEGFVALQQRLLRDGRARRTQAADHSS